MNTTLNVSGQILTPISSTVENLCDDKGGALAGLFFAGFISATILCGVIIIIMSV